MTLADQIIEHGPYRGGDQLPIEVQTADSAEINAFRAELIELMKLRAAAEARSRLIVDLDFWNDTALLVCMTCRARMPLGPDEPLAELVRRADEHTEECGR